MTTARFHARGAVHHLTAHLTGSELRLDVDNRKAEYLQRLEQAIQRTKWRLLGYALMSSHIQLGLEAGSTSVHELMQPLQSGFARWLNDQLGRSGPVWASQIRQTVVTPPKQSVGHVICYLHNAPVRAGAVSAAWDSNWTSHRAYLGLTRRPQALDVRRGLALCGLEDTGADRCAFDELVRLRAKVAREPWHNAKEVSFQPSDAPELGPERPTSAVAVCWDEETIRDGEPPVQQQQGDSAAVTRPVPTRVPAYVQRECTSAIARATSVDELVRATCARLGVEEQALRGPERGALLGLARRAAVWAWARGLGGPQTRICHALNRDRSACSRLLARLDNAPNDPARAAGEDIARELLSSDRTVRLRRR